MSNETQALLPLAYKAIEIFIETTQRNPDYIELDFDKAQQLMKENEAVIEEQELDMYSYRLLVKDDEGYEFTVLIEHFDDDIYSQECAKGEYAIEQKSDILTVGQCATHIQQEDDYIYGIDINMELPINELQRIIDIQD